MAGSITVSSITLDSDNTFSIKSNTGANLFALNSVNQSVTGNLSVDATGTTGIRSPSANTLVFYEGGVEAMRIDSSGNVGIGTSSPTFSVGTGLEVSRTGGVATIQATRSDASIAGSISIQGGSAQNNLYSIGAKPLVMYTDSTDRMRIDSSGNVGIGTSSPSRQLTVNKTAIFDSNGDGTTTSPSIAIGSTGVGLSYIGSQQLAFITNSAERGRFDSSGDFLFNSGYGSVATAYGCRAWVNFDGTTAANTTGTYSQTGTTVTVTITAHGYVTGSIAYLDFTSGTAVDGDYTVTVTDANTFTVTQASRTTSGNVTSRRNTIRGSGNVSSVTDNAVGSYTVNFTTAMPDVNYSTTGSTNGGGGRDTNFIVGLTASGTAGTYSTTAIQVLSYDIGAGVAADSSIVSVAIFR